MGQYAAYLAFWIEAMMADPRHLFNAASKAQAAADFLHNLQPKIETEPVEEPAHVIPPSHANPFAIGD